MENGSIVSTTMVCNDCRCEFEVSTQQEAFEVAEQHSKRLVFTTCLHGNTHPPVIDGPPLL